jgi:hypothetical protein
MLPTSKAQLDDLKPIRSMLETELGSMNCFLSDKNTVIYDAMEQALDLYHFVQFPTRLDHPGYRPLGFENSTRMGRGLTPTYECIHYPHNHDDTPHSLNSLLGTVQDFVQPLFTALSIGFPVITCRILHTPPQRTSKGAGLHIDQNLFTIHAGYVKHCKTEIIRLCEPQAYYGEMADIIGRVESFKPNSFSRPHTFFADPSVDYYAVVFFCVPHSSIQLYEGFTAEDFYTTRKEVHRNDEINYLFDR